jgi:cytochrome b561
MPDIGPHTKLGRLISLHLTVGALIALAVLVRVSWRLRHSAPDAIATEPRWVRVGARVTHATLYVLLLIVPLLGWAAASARGWRASLLPRLALPALLPRGSKSGFLAGDVHTFLAYTLLAIVALHIGAALYHRFILHDQVLARMLPRKASTPDTPDST